MNKTVYYVMASSLLVPNNFSHHSCMDYRIRNRRELICLSLRGGKAQGKRWGGGERQMSVAYRDVAAIQPCLNECAGMCPAFVVWRLHLLAWASLDPCQVALGLKSCKSSTRVAGLRGPQFVQWFMQSAA